jgi:hypothetical protein
VIIEAFRKTERNFLTPDPSKSIGSDSIIDISHESLIRQWSKLSGWLDAEAQDAQSWRRLFDAAADERKGVGGLLRSPNLQTLLHWRNQAKPTPEWAERYGATKEDFAIATRFLERSNRAQWRRRLVFGGSILGICLIIGGGLWKFSKIELQRKVEAADAQLRLAKAERQRQIDQARAEQDRLEIQQGVAIKEQKLAKANQERSARQAELSNEFFRITGQLFITTAQRDGHDDRWEESGSFIASVIDATSDDNIGKILKPLQGRMVAQYAFRTSQRPLIGTALRTNTRGNYRLVSLPGQEVAIVETRTGTEYRKFDVSDFEPIDQDAIHSVSPDGTQALVLVAETRTTSDGRRTRAGKSGIVFLDAATSSSARTVKVDDTLERPETLVVDWKNRRAVLSQWRDQTAEIVTLTLFSAVASTPAA